MGRQLLRLYPSHILHFVSAQTCWILPSHAGSMKRINDGDVWTESLRNEQTIEADLDDPPVAKLGGQRVGLKRAASLG